MAGRVAEAIDAHLQLLAVRPDLPDSWYNLAYLQRCDRRFEEALVSYGEALARGVSGAEEVHLNRAVILSEHLERGEEAEAELQAGLRLNPRFLTGWLNLGNLYEDWGDPARARAAYERALEIAPSNGRALARRTMIDIFTGTLGNASAQLRAALASPGISMEDAAELGFALGNALDAVCAYDQAFAAVAEANRASRQSAPVDRRYDPGKQEALVDALIAMTPPSIADVAPPAAPAPLFICGMFRSGSTLAEQILARHSRIIAGGELEFIPAMVRSRLQPYPQALAGASNALLVELRQSYLAELRAIHPSANLVTDKRVDNFLHIGLIKSIFPDARIVHTARHPLDNILSIYFLHFADGVGYGASLEDAAHYFGQYRRLMAHWQTRYPDDIFDLSYDLLVTDPEQAIHTLLGFLGLPPEPLMNQASATKSVRTPSAWQVREPLHTRSSGRWRNYEAQLAGVRRQLGL
jgi:tetratricopeptide (TPR) repeat protein